jgi:hypothetical protein
MPEGFYRELPDLLSQGDIASDIPWGLIEAPTTLCRPCDRSKPYGRADYHTADPWTGHPKAPGPWKHDPEIIHAVGWNGSALVLWHDCQIEKAINQNPDRPEKGFAAIAPVLPLDKLQSNSPEETAELRQGVRNNEHHSYFFLPETAFGDFSLPDSYVNLRYVWSVKQTTLLPRRKLSLAPGVLLSLYASIFVFFTRFRLDVDPVCPKCGTAVPLVKAEESDGAD